MTLMDAYQLLTDNIFFTNLYYSFLAIFRCFSLINLHFICNDMICEIYFAFHKDRLIGKIVFLNN